VKTRIQTGTISAVSDKDLKGLEQVANIMKTATQGERLEDGQPTSIQKGEMEHTDKTLEDILKGNGIIGAKLKESQRERSGEVIDRKADKDSGQAKKDSPVDPKPSPVKVPPGNDKPELDPKAPAKGV